MRIADYTVTYAERSEFSTTKGGKVEKDSLKPCKAIAGILPLGLLGVRVAWRFRRSRGFGRGLLDSASGAKVLGLTLSTRPYSRTGLARIFVLTANWHQKDDPIGSAN